MIPRKQFDAYNESVAGLSGGAAAQVEAEVLAWCSANPDATVAECREFAKASMAGAVQVYGEAAAALAAEWYDAQADGSGRRLPSAVTSAVYVPEKVDEVARYQARKLASGDVRGFARACGEYASNDVLRSLNETIIENVGRDKGEGVRFARVPTGAETCSFCYMLSSRGAVYHSRKTAGEFKHFHRRCDCKVVPGFEADQDAEIVEDYKPKEMRERMALIEEQTGLKFGDGGDMSALSREMGLRDARWLVDGTIPEYEAEKGACPSKREIKTANRLAEHGFRSRFRPVRDTEGLKTSDVFFVSGKQGEESLSEWDFKGVEGNGSQTIYHQFEEAAGQSRNIVIDLKDAGDKYDDKKYALRRAVKFINYHYKIETGMGAGSDWVFDCAIIIFKDGSIKKIAR